MPSPEPFEWIATALTIVAAVMVSLDLGRRTTGWGFVVFTAGSASWIAAALLDQEAPLGLTNMILLVINAIGVWRWLIRKGEPAAA